jgi:hypothetical protein
MWKCLMRGSGTAILPEAVVVVNGMVAATGKPARGHPSRDVNPERIFFVILEIQPATAGDGAG